jgi:hypothetical protein
VADCLALHGFPLLPGLLPGLYMLLLCLVAIKLDTAGVTLRLG